MDSKYLFFLYVFRELLNLFNGEVLRFQRKVNPLVKIEGQRGEEEIVVSVCWQSCLIEVP